jgi:hypothetical protein
MNLLEAAKKLAFHSALHVTEIVADMEMAKERFYFNCIPTMQMSREVYEFLVGKSGAIIYDYVIDLNKSDDFKYEKDNIGHVCVINNSVFKMEITN